MSPAPLALPLVCAALQLPHAVFSPAFDAGAELAAEMREVDEEFEKGDVNEHCEEGECEDEDEAEEIDIPGGDSVGVLRCMLRTDLHKLSRLLHLRRITQGLLAICLRLDPVPIRQFICCSWSNGVLRECDL